MSKGQPDVFFFMGVLLFRESGCALLGSLAVLLIACMYCYFLISNRGKSNTKKAKQPAEAKLKKAPTGSKATADTIHKIKTKTKTPKGITV